MSLDGMFKTNKQGQQDKNSSEMDDGEYRSRAEEETASASARKAAKRTSKRNTTEDPLLPEKKRARRRLIGALALVLAAIIGLPMIFDSEPKPTSNKIAIKIPSKDVINEAQDGTQNSTQNLQQNRNSPAPVLSEKETVADQKRAIVPVQQSIDATEEVVVAPSTSIKTPAAIDTKLVRKEVKVEPKIETKSEDQVDTKVAAKPIVEKKDSKDEAARALALLEGRTVAPAAAVAHQEIKVEAGFALQVGAYSTKEKVRELQSQLKAANITSYTQKIITKSGEVTRIRVGSFANKAEAEKIRAKLVKLGLNGTLISQ
jgi:DedD protein